MSNNSNTTPSSLRQKSSNNRLQQLSAQMAQTNGTSNGSAFTADVVPQGPEDAMFGLMAAYRRDTSNKKVDLGIGAYRDNNAKPWVLPVVKQVSSM